MNPKKNFQVPKTELPESESTVNLRTDDELASNMNCQCPDQVESAENASRNYFILKEFRSTKTKNKKANDGNGEQEYHPNEGHKVVVKIDEEQKDVIKPESPKKIIDCKQSAKKPEINKSVEKQSKSSLAYTEIRDMFKNPLLDYFSNKSIHRLSESHQVSNNFRLSNILSYDFSNGDINNSKFKRNSDLDNVKISESKINDDQKDNSWKIFGDENESSTNLKDIQNLTINDHSRVQSRNFTKSESEEQASLISQSNNAVKTNEYGFSIGLNDQSISQNMSFPVHKKQNSMHFETEVKKKSKSREKRNSKNTSSKDDKSNKSRKSSVSDENLCRAFSVDKSCIKTLSHKACGQNYESAENEQQIIYNMRLEEERTLSLLNDENEELDKVPKLCQIPMRSKLKFKNKIFEMNPKKSNIDNPQLNQSENPLFKVITQSQFSSFCQHKISMNNTLVFKEPSMFSTQDSRPSKQNKSFNAEISPSFDPILSVNQDCEQVYAQNCKLSRLNNESESQYETYADEESGIFNSLDQKADNFDQNDSKLKAFGANDQKKVKRTSTRKSHPVSNSNEYQIDINCIVHPNRTTLMIKNIPNRYTKDMMMEMIDRKFSKTYDFFYLPIDFDHDANVGYAFINFINIKYIKDFYLTFNGSKWPVFNSDKVCNISYARIQGLAACSEHFENSSLMKQNV